MIVMRAGDTRQRGVCRRRRSAPNSQFSILSIPSIPLIPAVALIPMHVDSIHISRCSQPPLRVTRNNRDAATWRGDDNGDVKFLANIREVDLIVHVVRCFDDPNVSHATSEEADESEEAS